MKLSIQVIFIYVILLFTLILTQAESECDKGLTEKKTDCGCDNPQPYCVGTTCDILWAQSICTVTQYPLEVQCYSPQGGDVELGEHVNASIDIDWGDGGPKVVIYDCGYVMPAVGKIKVTTGFDESSHQVDVKQGLCILPEITTSVWITKNANYQHTFVSYPNDIFIVNGDNDGLTCVHEGESTNEISISLVNTECETLRKAKDAIAQVYSYHWQTIVGGGEAIGNYCDCPLGVSETPYPKKNNLELVKLDTVSVEFKGFKLEDICENE